MSPEKQRIVGKALIWIGVLAWMPYVAMKYLGGMEVSVVPFLTAHLLCVIPGALLSRLARAARKTQGPPG